MVRMIKEKLVKAFIAQITADLAVMTEAALAAHEAATHTESKAEDQYDTRGLEASYLAGAQSKRALELEQLLAIFRNIDVRTFSENDPISATALIELSSEGKSSLLLLMPQGGGMKIHFEGKLVTIVTPQSPTGAGLLGRKVGDEIEVEIQRAKKEYEITRVW